MAIAISRKEEGGIGGGRIAPLVGRRNRRWWRWREDGGGRAWGGGGGGGGGGSIAQGSGAGSFRLVSIAQGWLGSMELQTIRPVGVELLGRKKEKEGASREATTSVSQLVSRRSIGSSSRSIGSSRDIGGSSRSIGSASWQQS